jgi:hypothetical protein
MIVNSKQGSTQADLSRVKQWQVLSETSKQIHYNQVDLYPRKAG